MFPVSAAVAVSTAFVNLEALFVKYEVSLYSTVVPKALFLIQSAFERISSRSRLYYLAYLAKMLAVVTVLTRY